MITLKDCPKDIQKEFASNRSEVSCNCDIASTIDTKYLPALINDSFSCVRYYISKFIDSQYLPLLMNDSEWDIRLQVAKRIDISYLPQMINDRRKDVRNTAIKRLEKETVKKTKCNICYGEKIK